MRRHIVSFVVEKVLVMGPNALDSYVHLSKALVMSGLLVVCLFRLKTLWVFFGQKAVIFLIKNVLSGEM